MRMRRQFVAFVVAVVATGVAGCSAEVEGRGPAGGTPSVTAGSPSTGTTGQPEATGAPGSSSGPLPTAKAGGNAATVCGDALTVSEKGTTEFVQHLSAVFEANGKGDTAAAKKAETKLESTLDTWAAGLRRVAAEATDAALRDTLTQLAGEVDTMSADIETIDDARLGAIQDRLDALCPN